MSRPPGLIYWENERPPKSVLVVLAVQHVFLMSSTLVLPVVLIGEFGGSFDQIRGVVAFTMIACGIGHDRAGDALPRFRIGISLSESLRSEFLQRVDGSRMAGRTSTHARDDDRGRPLRSVVRARRSPARISFSARDHRPGRADGRGLLVPLGTSKFLGITYPDEPISQLSPALAAATLLAMIAINVWGAGNCGCTAS